MFLKFIVWRSVLMMLFLIPMLLMKFFCYDTCFNDNDVCDDVLDDFLMTVFYEDVFKDIFNLDVFDDVLFFAAV